MSSRGLRRLETCLRKRRYETWNHAEEAVYALWRKAPSPRDLNPPVPYPCDLFGEKHYHIGHIK